MSLFTSILAKIFPSSHPAVVSPQPPSVPAAAPTSSSAPMAAAPVATVPPVDVEAVVSSMPGAANLHWKTSIVDLLKVLDLDSSFDSRKALAKELGYTGDTADSARMNVWLHEEVMAKLAANGGKVPLSLKD